MAARLASRVGRYFRGYNAYPNHAHFFIQSSHHCYLPQPHLYTADPSGEFGRGKGGELLSDWVARLPLRPGSEAAIATRCAGPEREEPQWSGDRYCDAKMAGKVVRAPA